jgi:hypothetical protein
VSYLSLGTLLSRGAGMVLEGKSVGRKSDRDRLSHTVLIAIIDFLVEGNLQH